MSSATTAAIALVLISAAFHATWNALLKTTGNPLAIATRAVGIATLVSAPLAAAGWLLAGRPGFPPEAWLLAALSSIVELVYFIFLSRAYERGQLSTVYPLARGTAPVVAVVIGLVVLREHLTPVEMGGVILPLAGIWTVRTPAGAGAATLPAVTAGICIGIYTAIDGQGVHFAPPWLYGWVLWAFQTVLMEAWSRFVEPERRADLPFWTSAVVGLCMGLAYLLVLFALRLAPLAMVSPLRESGIVLVALWSVWRLGERAGSWRKLGGAVVIVVGAALVAGR